MNVQLSPLATLSLATYLVLVVFLAGKFANSKWFSGGKKMGFWEARFVMAIFYPVFGLALWLFGYIGKFMIQPFVELWRR